MSENTGVQVVPIDKIFLTGWNPRGEEAYQGEKFGELKTSIITTGFWKSKALLVRPWEGGYQLIAGHRRLRAAQEVGLKEVPVMVEDLDDREAKVKLFLDNFHREDFEPLEEAKMIQELLGDGMKQDELGRKMGKSQSYIANRLRLLRAPDELKEMIISRKITPKHVITLLPFAEFPVFKEVILPDIKDDLNKGRPISVSDLEDSVRHLIEYQADEQVLPLHDFPYDVEKYRDFFDFSSCYGVAGSQKVPCVCKDIYTPKPEEDEPEECCTEKDANGVCSHLWGESCSVPCCRQCKEDCNSRCEPSAEEIEEDDEKEEPERYCLNRRCYSDKLEIAKQKYEKAHAEKVKKVDEDDTIDLHKLGPGEYERVGKWSKWDKTGCRDCKSNKKPIGKEYDYIEFVCLDPACAKRKEKEQSKKEAQEARKEAERAFEKLDAYITEKLTISDAEVRGLIKILVRHLWGDSIKKALKPWTTKGGKWNVDEVDKIPDDDVVKALLRLVFVQDLTAHNYQGVNMKAVEKVIAVFEGKPVPEEE